MGYYWPDCNRKPRRKYIKKDECCEREQEKHECDECNDECDHKCEGGTRWGASFLTPPSPPFPY
jgi:hypothetical protein